MENIIKFFSEGGLARIIEIVMGLIAVTTVITGMTKTPKDDEILAKIMDWVTRIFSLVTHKDAGGTFKLPLQTAKKPIEKP